MMAYMMPSCLFFFLRDLLPVLPHIEQMAFIRPGADGLEDSPHFRFRRQGFEKSAFLYNVGDLLFLFIMIGVAGAAIHYFSGYFGEMAIYAK